MSQTPCPKTSRPSSDQSQNAMNSKFRPFLKMPRFQRVLNASSPGSTRQGPRAKNSQKCRATPSVWAVKLLHRLRSSSPRLRTGPNSSFLKKSKRSPTKTPIRRKPEKGRSCSQFEVSMLSILEKFWQTQKARPNRPSLRPRPSDNLI